MSFPRSQRSYGSKAPSKLYLDTTLRAVLSVRRYGKALSASDIAGLARSYGRSEAQVIELAREAGCEVVG